MLNKVVTELTNIRIRVVCLVRDMGSNCIQLSTNVGVTPTNTKITLGNQDMYFYFDPPHLIKAVRNNLLKNKFHCDNKIASWQDIRLFYERDRKLTNRLAPKFKKNLILIPQLLKKELNLLYK